MIVFAKKLGMTQVFDEKSRSIPVTVLNLQKTVLAHVENDKASYLLVKEGAKSPKSLAGAYKTEGVRRVIESDGFDGASSGLEIKLEAFNEGDIVTIVGDSKGKGFAGTVKRHGFRTGPKTHGSCNYRKPGSIGDTGPQRVLKGKKMSGRMAAHQVKVKNVKIVKVDVKGNNLWLSGPIPGPNKSVLIIKK